MADIVHRNVGSLTPTARAVIEDLLGRKTKEDETVSIEVGGARSEREQAAARLQSAMDSIAASTQSFPDDEVERIIDEACDEVRHRKV